MERNNGQTIFLSVIGIATLLVAIIGATFAYFTTTMTRVGEDAGATITTATVGSVGFSTTSPSSNTNILPGWEGTGTASVYFTSASEKGVGYECKVYLAADSAITDHVLVQGVSATVAGVSDSTDLRATTATALTTSGVVIATGTIPAAAANEIVSGKGPEREVTYKVIYEETGTNQNSEQGQDIKTTVSCALTTGATVYYNNANPNGTATQPTVPSGN